jgi:hypothetical protein
VVLTGLECPGQTLLDDVAATADGLRFFDLKYGGSGVADREEQLRVFVKARGAVAPVHGDISFMMSEELVNLFTNSWVRL